MTGMLHVIAIDSDLAVLAARRRARELSAALGFTSQDQTRIATSVLEVARAVLGATLLGRAEFLLDVASHPQALQVRFVAPATHIERITGGDVDHDASASAMGVLAAQRLMDACSFDDVAGDAVLTLTRRLPAQAPRFAADDIANVAARVQGAAASSGGASLDEVQRQNRELVDALSDLQERQDELTRLTRELEDTNRGVVALYAELDERAHHLRRADEAKSRFLSNMSHEFRTPLYSIRALSKLLLNRVDGELTDEQDKQVRFIFKAAEELSETVDDLLDIAKIEAGKIELAPAEFEVANLFSALRGMLRPLLPASGVDLVFEPCDDIPPVYTDEGKVSQILRNFISNALKFTERGEVRVSAQYDAVNQLLTFSVSDTGIGIAPEHQQSVFEEFEQVENRLQTYVKGTGLGLPLCSKLCTLLGGTVGLTSELGKGSTFTATIRANLAPGAGVVPGRPTPCAETGPLAVVLVSTDPHERQAYEASLRNTRFRPTVVGTLREARSLLEAGAAHALVIDAQAGREESWAWLEALRQEEQSTEASHRMAYRNGTRAGSRLPVIVVSQTDYRERAQSLGADAFFTKPFSGSELLASLDAMLGAH